MTEEVKLLKAGSYIIYKNQPYQVRKNQIVVTGTHSHTKVKLDLQSLFTGQYETITLPPHDRVEDVEIIRKRAQLISKMASAVQVMDMTSYETFDAEVSEALLNELNEGDEVTFVEFQGRFIVLEKR